jgi:hypothetical protein
MEDFERQLKYALARKEQPPSFEAKTFAAIASERSGRGSGRGMFWRWEALAASTLVAAGLWAQHERGAREQAAGEAARSRLQLALRITVSELSKIQKSVNAAHSAAGRPGEDE